MGLFDVNCVCVKFDKFSESDRQSERVGIEGTKVCRYSWHSAGSPGWPFPVLKYRYIFRWIIRNQFYQTALGSCMLWFEISKMLTAVKKINLSCYLLLFSAHFRSLYAGVGGRTEGATRQLSGGRWRQNEARQWVQWFVLSTCVSVTGKSSLRPVKSRFHLSLKVLLRSKME